MTLYQIGSDIQNIRESLDRIEQSGSGPLKLGDIKAGNVTCKGTISDATCGFEDAEKCYAQLKTLDDKIQAQRSGTGPK